MLNYYNAHSIHIYGWVFTFEDRESVFDKNTEWINNSGWKLRINDFRNDIDFFGRQQYFSMDMNQVFKTRSMGICKVYDYPLNSQDNNIYKIILPEKKVYELSVDSIELHLYSYGVGILFFRCLNGNADYSIEDIKKINDYGRRTAIPFIPTNKKIPYVGGDRKKGYILCAEQLIFYVNNKKTEYSFRKCIVQGRGIENRADFPYKLLRGESECNFHQKDKKNNKEKISPVSDDRMQLISLVRNSGLSELIKFNTLDDKELHAIIYVDSSDSTCQDDEMCLELLKRAVYPRWRKTGTIHAVTDYSMFCLTAGVEETDINASVIKPFVTQFPYMLSVVLAQRVVMDILSKKAGEIADNMNNKFANKPHFRIKSDLQKQINLLQCSYVRFCNQIMISEITPQQQGQEIYQLLQKHHRIEEKNTLLQSQLQELYNLFTSSKGFVHSLWANRLAVIAIILAIPAVLQLIVQLFIWIKNCL